MGKNSAPPGQGPFVGQHFSQGGGHILGVGLTRIASQCGVGVAKVPGS